MDDFVQRNRENIEMVEETLKDAEKYLTPVELWKALPKPLPYDIVKQILIYLKEAHRIIYDRGKIVWVAPDNVKLQKLLETAVDVKEKIDC